jgi:dihydrofolate reductase
MTRAATSRSATGRRVRLFIASSLDGFIAREDGAIDWLFTDADYGYTAFYDQVDTVVMGRRTYELSLSFGPDVYAGRAVYVFSRTRTGGVGDSATFVREGPAALVARLREAEGRDIWLVGGSMLVRDFLAAGMVDDLILSVHPILLGGGIPLFLPHPRETRLRLRRSEAFPSGLVQLVYDTHPAAGGRRGRRPSTDRDP